MVTYLDYSATTPIDPRVAEIVRHYMEVEFGNAGSRTHQMGQVAKKAVQTAREQVAAAMRISPEELVFTSGATEANNIAILGLEEEGRKSGRTHLICSEIEHKAVLEPMAEMERRGFSVTRIPPEPGGWVSPERVAAELRPETLLVSVMHANNETGVIQPIQDVARALIDHPAYFHVDAAQSFCKLPGLEDPRIDMVSVSGHKIFGPKGIGALGIRKRKWQRVPIKPLLWGGGQERGIRPGTLPVMLIAGFGLAAEVAASHREHRASHCSQLSDMLRARISEMGGTIFSDLQHAGPFATMFALPGMDSEAMLLILNQEGFCLSNGAACTSHSYSYSHVLKAMGSPEHLTKCAIRVSVSHQTTAIQIEELILTFEKTIQETAHLGPFSS